MRKFAMGASIILGIGLLALATTEAMAQQVQETVVSATSSSTTTQTVEVVETRDLMLRVKAGLEGAMSTSTTKLASFWTLVGGVEVPVIWRETALYFELGLGIWRPDSGFGQRTAPFAGSAGFFGAYYPTDWMGIRAGLKGYLFQGRYAEDGMIAQMHIEGDLLFNFASGLELILGVSGSVMGTGYRNSEVRETLGPAWYPHISLRYSWDIWDSPPP